MNIKSVIRSFLFLILLTKLIAAEDTTIKIAGKIVTASKDTNFISIAHVSIHLLEIDNEPVEEAIENKEWSSDEKGNFMIQLNQKIIPDIDDIISIKVNFKKIGYQPSSLNVGPINFKEKTYYEKHTIYLIPGPDINRNVELITFKLDADNCIYSKYPSERQDVIGLFKPIKDFETAKRIIASVGINDNNKSPIHFRVAEEIEPIYKYLSINALKLPDVKNDPDLQSLFLEVNKSKLYSLIIPVGKAWRFDDNFHILRNEAFNTSRKLFEKAQFSDSKLNNLVKKYKNLFCGNFEPTFIITIKNNEQKSINLTKLYFKITNIRGLLGARVAGAIPISAIYEFTIPHKKGLFDRNLNPELTVPPNDVISFKIRLNSEQETVWEYTLNIILADQDGPLVETQYFILQI